MTPPCAPILAALAALLPLGCEEPLSSGEPCTAAQEGRYSCPGVEDGRATNAVLQCVIADGDAFEWQQITSCAFGEYCITTGTKYACVSDG